VTTTADTTGGDGLCSLREAVIRSNTDVSIDGECAPGPPGADVIVLGPGTFRLARAGRGEDNGQTGDLDLIGPVEIVGAGVSATTIDAAGIDRVMEARPGSQVTIRGVRITGGAADPGVTGPSTTLPGQGILGGTGTPGACGGGILATTAALRISDSAIAGNAAGAGGQGTTETGPTGLLGRGGSGGPGGAGGGICIIGGAFTLSGVTVSANRAGAGGGGGNGFGGGGQAAAGGVGAGGAGGSGEGGSGGDGGRGGGVNVVAGGALTVSGSRIDGNRAGDGGSAGNGSGGVGGGGGSTGPGGIGLAGGGGDGGGGGGLWIAGPATVSRSLIDANGSGAGAIGGVGVSTTAALGGDGGPGGDGGGIGSTGATLALSDVTITDNSTGGGGGGGAHSAAPAVKNGAGGAGGQGGGVFSSGPLIVGHATLVRNGSGAAGSGALGAVSGARGSRGVPGSGSSGAVRASGSSTISRSIIAGNACDTTSIPIVDDTLNIAFQAPGCIGSPLDPRLGPLAANGGPTPTMRPGPGSPAIDREPAGAGCSATDQRGALRPGGAACDVGAFEIVLPVATTGGASPVGGSSATVAGTVDTRGLDTAYRVEFGATTAYGRQVAASATGAPAPTALSVPLTGLTPVTTYHYRLVAIGPDGTATGVDRTFTTTTATVVGGPGAPRVTRLTVAPRAFAVVPRGASLRPPAPGRIGFGSRISFVLSEPAAVRIVIQRNVAGHRVRRAGRVRCVALAPARRVARAQRCVVRSARGTLRVARARGASRVTLTGRLGNRTLAPGSYRVVVTATDATGARSLPARAPFTVLRRKG
jgi:CSLREA domain-containing protein